MQKVRDLEQQYAMPQAVQNYSASKLLQSSFKAAQKQRKSSVKAVSTRYAFMAVLGQLLENEVNGCLVSFPLTKDVDCALKHFAS